ncbi:MAG TPA: T9SS type A sorting domain-containing protein, partial [Bacteroidia bacterium]|nr:T9SS type A sorting domain-containing protein [Bacteroidia bacterium]
TTSTTKATLSGKYYKVCVTSPYGCGTACDSILYNSIEGIASINKQSNTVDVFPNPNSGQVTVLLRNTGYRSLAIYDVLGKAVYTEMLTESKNNYSLNIDMSNLSNGLYILQIQTATGTIHKDITLQK